MPIALKTRACDPADRFVCAPSVRPGKVILVGAGPGVPDLLTVRAVQRIGAGDGIVYDRLIHPGVLALAKPSAEKIFMGKTAGDFTHARTTFRCFW